MKNLNSKQCLGFALSAVFLISGCSSISNAHTQTATPSLQTIASDSMEKVLPNGKTEPVKAPSVNKEREEWFRQKQSDLQETIANTLSVSKNDVNLLLASVSDSEIGCAMVLNTDVNIEKKQIDQVKKQIVDVVNQESTDLKINEENITVSNSKGEIF
ncbi:hypothetical protein [Saccharibacillus sp. JS10]|uniref:hypothetical protein n=1 Tax=Saccharibacillus sp. JS10 TaxID=2950552 RepID=UPI0021095937|nr:hypothetical protein [Saccharibacillus sp. JS10]MCQ4087373.1 hypothetical protein [Saccharibacillus sp. JS10]